MVGSWFLSLSVDILSMRCLLYQKAFNKLKSEAVKGTCDRPHSLPRFLLQTCAPSGLSIIPTLLLSLSHFCLSLDMPAVCAGVIYCQMVIFLTAIEFYEV